MTNIYHVSTVLSPGCCSHDSRVYRIPVYSNWLSVPYDIFPYIFLTGISLKVDSLILNRTPASEAMHNCWSSGIRLRQKAIKCFIKFWTTSGLFYWEKCSFALQWRHNECYGVSNLSRCCHIFHGCVSEVVVPSYSASCRSRESLVIVFVITIRLWCVQNKCLGTLWPEGTRYLFIFTLHYCNVTIIQTYLEALNT